MPTPGCRNSNTDINPCGTLGVSSLPQYQYFLWHSACSFPHAHSAGSGFHCSLQIARARTFLVQAMAPKCFQARPPQQGQFFPHHHCSTPACIQTAGGLQRTNSILRLVQECQDQKTRLKHCTYLRKQVLYGNKAGGEWNHGLAW